MSNVFHQKIDHPAFFKKDVIILTPLFGESHSGVSVSYKLKRTQSLKVKSRGIARV
jgi:hypothetical protein